MSEAKVKNWQEMTLKKLGDRNQTPKGLPAGLQTLENMANWQVWEFSPNKKLDEIPGQSIDRGKRYKLVGRDWSIALQASQIKALHDILGDRLGFDYTFEDWFAQWEEGFPAFINRPANKTLKTNYAASKTETVERWRGNADERPAYIEWANPNPSFSPGYRVIEYFPSRADPTTSVVLVGSDSQLVDHIIRYHSSAQSQEDEALGFRKTLTPKTTGHPSVHFYFYKRDTSTNKKYFAEYSYILRDFVEFEGLSTAGEKVISKADIRQLATRIEQQFLPNRNSPFVLQKGREIYTYQLFNKGYHMWVPARNQTAAVDLFTRILATRPDTFDDRWMRKSQAVNPSKVYPPTPPSVTVLNRPMQLDEKHPIVDVPFRYAWIELPCVGERHILVSLSTRKQRSPEIFID